LYFVVVVVERKVNEKGESVVGQLMKKRKEKRFIKVGNGIRIKSLIF
jgi:hypothetical protein